MDVDATAWSGDGSFTQLLVDTLRGTAGVHAIRVEDAPASRSEAGYNFIANEIFVIFERRAVQVSARLLGVIPWTRRASVPALTLADLGRTLAADARIGEADYADEGMIQYLRTERIVAPYQTRGIKLIELVRIYSAVKPEGLPSAESKESKGPP